MNLLTVVSLVELADIQPPSYLHNSLASKLVVLERKRHVVRMLLDRVTEGSGVMPGPDFVTSAAPFMELVGPVVGRSEGDGYTLEIELDERHANGNGYAHGSLIATLADLALGNELARSSRLPPRVTISLALEYMAPARIGDLLTVQGARPWLGGGSG